MSRSGPLGPRHPFPILFLVSCLAFPLHAQSSPAVDERAACQRTLSAHPWRLDVRLRLADLYGAAGDFEAQYDLWARTLQMTDKGYKRLRWEKDGPLPHRSSRLIPPRLEGTIGKYLGMGTREGTERALRLSKLAVTYYPAHPEFQRARALCYARQGDMTAAVKVLLRLLEKDPHDGSTLSAMGDALWEGNKRKEAQVYYQKALAAGKEGAWTAGARRRLEGTGND